MVSLGNLVQPYHHYLLLNLSLFTVINMNLNYINFLFFLPGNLVQPYHHYCPLYPISSLSLHCLIPMLHSVYQPLPYQYTLFLSLYINLSLLIHPYLIPNLPFYLTIAIAITNSQCNRGRGGVLPHLSSTQTLHRPCPAITRANCGDDWRW